MECFMATRAGCFVEKKTALLNTVTGAQRSFEMQYCKQRGLDSTAFNCDTLSGISNISARGTIFFE